ncbi:lytic transglycosylase domain-containing protein [Agromyces bracchium]|uniref:Transglycosylase SLT domain-containing protein n=1 Tax=Agromyces bracchium TaxID=88376 RepID=A0A6I3M4Q0_9MICO|nr:lytic transglycosylase domain-containing protein [Agromyces bracchium]MTH67062.1 transglycosylase SLT domain-containing protein [Agromyces bracchium]
MTWDDDATGDDRREPRSRPSAREVLLQVAGYLGLVTAVVALVVGAVFAVTVWGVAAKPGGFAAPSAAGRGAPLPPVTSSTSDGDADAAARTEAADDPNAVTGSEVAPLVEPEPEVEAAPVVEGDWLSVVSDATGIPARALAAYALAHVAIAAEEPQCGVDWTTIAAIGAVESGHGSHGDSELQASGQVTPKILGPALDGDGVAAIHDTDGGALDGDATWDRAVGPMQFIPSTWEQWGADANGDGVADPSQIDDAAYAAARYLCASGPMTSPEGWRGAVFSYNHLESYVDKVAGIANGYADALG